MWTFFVKIDILMLINFSAKYYVMVRNPFDYDIKYKDVLAGNSIKKRWRDEGIS